jgi:hypothetical protein
MDYVPLLEVCMESTNFNIRADDMTNSIAFIREKDGDILGCIDVNKALQTTSSSSLYEIALYIAKGVKRVPHILCVELLEDWKPSIEHRKEVKNLEV